MKLKILNKLLSILITTLLVIQPLSGSITTFQNIAYSAQNIDLEKVKNVAFEYIGHNLYSPNSPYPQIQEYIPKTAIHSIVGGALAELAGGDFSQGAIATAVSHNVAEYLKDKLYSDFDPKNPPFDKNDPQAIQDYANLQEEIIKGVSSVVSGAITLATHENVTDKELEIAQSMGESVAENNAFFLPVIYVLGGLMTAYDTYSTYQDEGAYEAIKSLIVDGIITVGTAGASKYFKIGDKVFDKLDDAYDYYKTANPYIKNSTKIDTLPNNVQDMYKKYSDTGWKGKVSGQADTTKAGAIYKNSNEKLPTIDSNGNTITYKEFDINDVKPRDNQRFVKGSDGKVYYTNDHYATFIKIDE